MPPNPSTSATASASYQLPDLLSLVRKIELRTNRHCRPVTLASEKWFSEELWEGFRNVEDGNGNVEEELTLIRCLVDPRGRHGRGGRGDEGEKEQGKERGKGRASTSHSLDLTISQMKIGLLASICFPTCDMTQLRLVTDFWTMVMCENEWILRARACSGTGGEEKLEKVVGRDEEVDVVDIVRRWWGLKPGELGKEEGKEDDVLNVLEKHAHFKYLIPQLIRLCKTMSPRWNDQFSREIFKLRDAQIEVAKYRSPSQNRRKPNMGIQPESVSGSTTATSASASTSTSTSAVANANISSSSTATSSTTTSNPSPTNLDSTANADSDMNSTPLPTPPQTPTKAVAPLLVDASPPSTPMSTDQMPILNQPDQESPPTALLNPKDLTCLTETTYIPLRRRFSGIGVIFCFVEALEGLELDEFCSTDATSSTPRDGERGNDVESGKGKEKERAGKREKEENDRDLEKMKELVGDIIGLAWDVFSFNIDQSIAFDPFNIVNVLVQCKHGRGVSGVTSGRGQGVSGTMVSPRSPGAGAGPAVGSESGIGAPGLGSKRGTGVGIGSLGAAIHQTGNIVKAKFEEYERVERGLVRRCGLGDVDGGENWDGHAGARMVGGKEEGSGVSSLLKRWLWGTGTSSKRGVGLGGLATNVYPQSSKNTNAKDVEEGPYTNSALTDLSLYLLGLKDCLVGSLNWAYETEMFFGTKGDSVRGYGWVFLLPRDEE